MTAAAEAIEALVRQTRAVAADDDPKSLKAALSAVLAELEVRPRDPAWADGCDVAGEAYERLLPAQARRTLGQFFTPLWLGRTMASWLLAERTKLLLDAGCGSGALLIAAAQERGRRKTGLLGLDVDPLALGMARLNGVARSINALELRQGDFLLDEFGERPDAVICNPPYTRHHDVPSEQKTALHDRFEQRLGIRLSHLASLHVLFLVRALEVSSDTARIAFITPAHWLDMNYGREIKKLLLERAHVEAVISFPADALLFHRARTTAAITLIRKDASPRRSTRMLHVDGRPAAAAEIRAALAAPMPVDSVVLVADQKWSRDPAKRRAGIALGELACVRRGIATGCNAFFVLSEQRRRALALNRSYLRPCISSPRYVTGTELRTRDLAALGDTVPRWLLAAKSERSRGPLARYLARGKTEFEVHERYLVQQRIRAGRPWFAVERPAEAPILFSYFNRSRARFVRNHANATALNTWLLIQPLASVDPDALFAILTSRAVMGRLQNECRSYGSGLWKLEPSELLNLWLPRHALQLIH